MAQNGISTPELSLPKGGGALKGLGEAFQPNLFSGTANLTIPIYTTQGRSAPSLNLSYSSGAGNGSFGLGFQLSVPNITRKTERGIPCYDDDDIFILSGTEELVLVSDDGPHTTNTEHIFFYQPRIEGLFARIEKRVRIQDGDVHWRITTRDNVTNVYGKTPTANARIADPDDPRRIFCWLLEETIDAQGSRTVYRYHPEDGLDRGTAPARIYSDNRSLAQRYLHSIQYGNYRDEQNQERFAFEVVFDYGEYDISPAKLSEAGADPYRQATWPMRADPFSSYRSGFEIRNARLCRNILTFHSLPELGDRPCLVRATEFTYNENPTVSYLTAVTQHGFQRQMDGSYWAKSLPPLELAYSSFEPGEQHFQSLSMDDPHHPITGYLTTGGYSLVDLHGEGITGVLYTDGESARYWPPLGQGRFGPPIEPAPFPLERQISRSPNYALIDVYGRGRRDLVVDDPPRAGFYASLPNGGWDSFQSFTSFPVEYRLPEAEHTDITGDGLTDIVVVESQYTTVYSAEGACGYRQAQKLLHRRHVPPLFNEPADGVVRYADIFGDGLSHRVQISDGSVACWPNLGYGRFGPRVDLENAPRFEPNFDASRLFLADLDGSGTADIIYVHQHHVDLYLNQSGNGFAAEPIQIPLPVAATQLTAINLADVLGNGTTCLIVTSPHQTGLSHQFVPFAGDQKPHLLTRIQNNLGAVTRIEYATSVDTYLDDREAGRTWTHPLPFPVHVLARVEHEDAITGSRTVTRYRFHDGYYDPVERDFRGFAFVEHWDTESFADFSDTAPAEAHEHYVMPTYTRTWHHTGDYDDKGVLSARYAADYFQGDPDALHFPDSRVDENLAATRDGETIRQAHRALKGQVLRQEIYGLDDDEESPGTPYRVTEANVEVRLLRPRGDGPYAIFLVTPRESIEYDYERVATDPRVQHSFTLDVDAYGNSRRRCTVYYGRRPAPGADYPPQQTQLKTEVTVQNYCNEAGPQPEKPYRYLGVPYEIQTFEVGGLAPDAGNYFSFSGLIHQLDEAFAQPVHSHDQPLRPDQRAARLLTWKRIYYSDADGASPLPLGSIGAPLLHHHSAEAAFSQTYFAAYLREVISDSDLSIEGGYISLPSESGVDPDPAQFWWNPGLYRTYLGADGYFLPEKTVDPFGAETTVTYDAPYYIHARQLIDARGHITQAELDYQTCQAWRVVDVNLNSTEARFDPLGMVIVTSVYGQQWDEVGETIDQGDDPVDQYSLPAALLEDPPPAELLETLLGDPANYVQNATGLFYYDLHAWMRDGQTPAHTVNLVRETHVRNAMEQPLRFQQQLTYWDGFGRLLETKIRTEPGPVQISLDKPAEPPEQAAERWLCSGRKLYDNKGQPIKAYEPFFSDTALFEPEALLADLGITPIHTYDPLGRVIRIDTPRTFQPQDQTDPVLVPQAFFSRVTFTPWDETHWDANDTVLESPYYQAVVTDPRANPDELDALQKAAVHANTPTVHVYDNQGGHIQIIERKDRTSPPLITRRTLDIQGQVIEEIDPRLYVEEMKFPSGFDAVRPNFRYLYAMQGQMQVVDSVDMGWRTTLSTAMNETLRTRDMIGTHIAIRYDELRRPTQVVASAYDEVWDDDRVSGNYTSRVVETMSYGDDPKVRTSARTQNSVGRLVEHRDGAGLLVINHYDIAGNVLSTERYPRQEYRAQADWAGDEPLENDWFVTTLYFDALDRVIYEGQWGIRDDTNETVVEVRPHYLAGGQLGRIECKSQSGEPVPNAIDAIEYNARGQRTRVDYGNGVTTRYTYEPQSYRLRKLTTSQASEPASTLQDITYTYDPVGNVTRLRDDSYSAIFGNSQADKSLNDYTYDALDRLIAATGQAHPDLTPDDHRTGFKQSRFVQNAPTALAGYTRYYTYDDGNNLTETRHVPDDPNRAREWTRSIDIDTWSNRATLPRVDGQRTGPVNISGNGNFTAWDNLPHISWTVRDQIARIDLVKPNGSVHPDSEYYLYDRAGRRARKVRERLLNVEQSNETLEISDTVYVGAYELTRVSRRPAGDLADTVSTQRLRLRRRVMDGDRCVLIIDQQLAATSDAPQPEMRVRTQLVDHLGSVALELDESARVISYEAYFPYGETAFIAGPDRDAVARKRYRYSGEERDDGTGLYYYGARYYMPWCGRWLSPDPAGTVDGLNLYGFVRGNPIRRRDVGGMNGDEVEWRLTDTAERNLLSLSSLEYSSELKAGITGIVDLSTGEIHLQTFEPEPNLGPMGTPHAQLASAVGINTQQEVLVGKIDWTVPSHTVQRAKYLKINQKTYRPIFGDVASFSALRIKRPDKKRDILELSFGGFTTNPWTYRDKARFPDISRVTDEHGSTVDAVDIGDSALGKRVMPAEHRLKLADTLQKAMKRHFKVFYNYSWSQLELLRGAQEEGPKDELKLAKGKLGHNPITPRKRR